MNRILINRTLLSLIVLFIMNSCALDEDLDPNSGDNRDKFTGTWLFTETPVARGTSYSVSISNDPSNSSQVLLSNIANFGGSHSAYGIVTSQSISIPSQEIYPGMEISGFGSLISSDEMSWTYTLSGGGDIENFEATATK